MKIMHLSDTHILNLKRHEEYNLIFEEIYRIAREQKVDYIIHTGDIAHTKTHISPEFVEMATKFLRSLSEIAPTHVILGNHDVNLKNDNRTDAISPIINAINSPNLTLYKYSGEFSVNNDVTFNVLSRLDEENWRKPSDPTKINIALYHGAVAGSKTDVGHMMNEGEHTINAFEGHDYVFLGDIHKSNQILDMVGKVRYPGSTIQQNYGETDDKGFLIWDIKDKETFSCKHYLIPNPNPFTTILLDGEGNLPETDVKNGCRLRIVADNNVSVDKIKKATEIAKTKFFPLSVVFVNKANIAGSDADVVSDIISNDQNLRDINVQEGLIRDYLKDFKADEEVVDRVIALNKQYNSEIEESEEVYRGINWKLKTLEWENLFNYGGGNRINFDNLNGIVGIFGKNYSGKSSIIDSLLYTVYNSTSKNNRKNLNVINQNLDTACGKVEVEINDETYTISRTSEKYTKKLKGVVSTEAKTDVEFSTSGDSLNGLARNDTDKNIRKFFGTVDDFFLTSMASQFGYLSFIGEGSTNRKSILAKFLDLEPFERKYKKAKEESAQLKALLKKLEGNDYDRDIAVAEMQVTGTENSINDKKNEIEMHKKIVEQVKKQVEVLVNELKSIPLEIIDYASTKSNLDEANNKKLQLNNDNVKLSEEKKNTQQLLEKIENFLKLIDIKELTIKEEELEKLNKEMISLEKEISKLETSIKAHSTKLKLLEDIPCGNQFTNCKFIKDAFLSKSQMVSDKGSLLDNKNTYSGISDRFNEIDSETADKRNKIAQATAKKDQAYKKILNLELEIEKNNLNIERVSKLIDSLEEKIKIYEENRETIENFAEKNNKKIELEKEIKSICSNLELSNRELIELYRQQGSFNEKVENLKRQKEELESSRREYAAYDLFQTCMHSNGISYGIIKQKLPVINAEIAKILSNIVEFSIFLVNDDDKLDIMIKHPKYDARPLEMGSGAEKTLASTAIRLALLNVTTLPRGDIFILDEPGTALDGENLDGFVKILELIKSYFKTVLIISHLDSLKDCVDTQIIIEQKGGYAHVNM
jgi:exonuclease SbcC